MACDISATMLDHVRQSAAAAGLQNVETLESAADDLDEKLPPFDAAISRLGLMLFPSPGRALKALQRVLKPGARFAALVFTTTDNNPFLARTMAIVLRCAGKSPPKPGQPELFALGGKGILEDLSGIAACPGADKAGDGITQVAERISCLGNDAGSVRGIPCSGR